MICDSCSHYIWDEETQSSFCDVSFDEDEYAAMLNRNNKECPYFSLDDEYATVRHQI